MLPLISPVDAFQKLREGKIRLVDIREPDEVTAVRVPGAEVVPLSVIKWAPLPQADEKLPIVFTCNSGKRTSKQSDQLEELAAGPAWQLDGGVSAWAKAGLPVERGHQAMPMFRQIQIGAGALVLLGLVGVFFWPPMIWLTALVGAGLIFAGLTGFCGLGLLLSAMPWNKK